MEGQQEAILQAVVLADPFEHQSRYGPLVKGGNESGEGCESANPWCLLPFLNSPLIAWTLESLSASNVQVAWIVVRDGAKELQEWLDSSTFMSPTAPMTIRIKQTQAISEGDVMREVDGLALAGDWLLVKAGYIGNLELETAVTDFTAKRKKDPSLLMECIVTSRTRSTRASAPAKTSTHVMSSEKQLLHYLHQPQYPARKRTHFPLEHIESGKTLLVRTDLESVGVDICNMEVPALFVENFDYQNMRPDFINGVLTSDLLGKSISCTVIGEGQSLGTTSPRAQPWAAHVSDVSSYASISKSVISRWSYPLVLDEVVPGEEERYEQRRGRLYLGRKLNLARSCTTGPAAVIGRRTIIGERSDVLESVIGENCRIGSEVRIINSYLYNGVVVNDGCVITDSIIGEGVHVQGDAQLSQGTLVGAGVTIGEGASLRSQRVSTEAWGDDEDEEEIEEQEKPVNGNKEGRSLGTGAQGHIWPSEEEVHLAEQDSDDEDALDVRNLRTSSLAHSGVPLELSDDEGHSDSSASTISRSSSSDDLASEGDSDAMSDISEPPAIAGIGALGESDATDDMAFKRECLSSLERSFGEGHTVDNAAIELKTLRMASNVALKDVTGVVVPFLCDQILAKEGAPANEVVNSVNKLVERWGALVDSLTGRTQGGMVEALFFLQEHCATKEGVHPRLFPAFLQAFYEEDVVSEEAIRAWVTNPAARTTGGAAGAKLWQIGANFMRALMEAEDDDDDEDEDEDSE
ncbi:hypothetical protein P389DRAFT_178044 [Cystobasidium minutum MCA 4210]|uniref:uncharacterized protein n=1 Tax=Cystobasidium minutum MCA 4210 TaxID=1397322 RepID=UPI0034CF0F7F|eukprot:jgi/Rhomi1/178044/fgenesh1_pg.2_\